MLRFLFADSLQVDPNDAPAAVSKNAAQNPDPASDAPSWRELVFDGEILDDILPPWAHTSTNKDGIPEVDKRNCSETFERPPFVHGNGYVGGPKQNFKRKPHDHPIDYFSMYAPEKWRYDTLCVNTNRKCVDRNFGVEVCVIFAPLCIFCIFFNMHMFTYVKTLSADFAVPLQGGPYKDWEPFGKAECDNFLAVQLAQGCTPKPSMTMWFQRSVNNDVIFCNDTVSFMFPRGVTRWKEYRSGFSVVRVIYLFILLFCEFLPNFSVSSSLSCAQADIRNAKNPTVLKDKMWRTRPMLQQIWNVNRKIWDLSHKLSIDEQTLGFQGRGYVLA